MSPYDIAALLILILPLVSFAGLSFFGKRMTPCLAGIIGTSVLFVSMALALVTAYGYFFQFGAEAGHYVHHTSLDIAWLQFNENLSIHLGIVLDPISVMMLVVITVVSFMVHLYSFKYMHGEERFSTYY
ncbi:MAG TPA: hypothetical protein VHO72_14340 [Bacteroidales bacterium]|nr:hypothetical protein [Bacteroidales bacterium]